MAFVADTAKKGRAAAARDRRGDRPLRGRHARPRPDGATRRSSRSSSGEATEVGPLDLVVERRAAGREGDPAPLGVGRGPRRGRRLALARGGDGRVPEDPRDAPPRRPRRPPRLGPGQLPPRRPDRPAAPAAGRGGDRRPGRQPRREAPVGRERRGGPPRARLRGARRRAAREAPARGAPRRAAPQARRRHARRRPDLGDLRRDRDGRGRPRRRARAAPRHHLRGEVRRPLGPRPRGNGRGLPGARPRARRGGRPEGPDPRGLRRRDPGRPDAEAGDPPRAEDHPPERRAGRTTSARPTASAS